MNRSALGWVEIILGLLMVVMGVYTVGNPGTALGAVVIAYALLAILSGVAEFVLYFRMQRRSGFGPSMLLVAGVLNILVGILLLFNIGAGVWTLSILFPIWFILHCVARLVNVDFVRAFGSRFEYWMSLIINILGIILAGVLLFNPFASAAVLVYFVAAYLFIEGIGSIILGFGNVGRV